ncbi:FitA-like ribbon-helix-helix domain-containing protein [Acidithiobacillus concretivorus]|jgi:plasmid stability protein|uniref:Arc family DNA-binding protein n=1 Tax=Acidithiobacillus concretivorus TaxID=3063952 RepID=A0ABS5ZQ06_9PROT|nr:Arc family DNA-binding protein [Acidithiobacillus concretivorus]MBU2738691.1 Arc family DNA-binding protein [Acidithiobacillus concretivorus]
MTTSLTLKNIPDEVYQQLKASAMSHRRSMNSEAIVCLETALNPNYVCNATERIERARALRAALPMSFSAQDIDAYKREGRS